MHQYATFITNAIFMHLFYSISFFPITKRSPIKHWSLKNNYAIKKLPQIVLLGEFFVNYYLT